jgi:hypothetical protein
MQFEYVGFHFKSVVVFSDEVKKCFNGIHTSYQKNKTTFPLRVKYLLLPHRGAVV